MCAHIYVPYSQHAYSACASHQGRAYSQLLQRLFFSQTCMLTAIRMYVYSYIHAWYNHCHILYIPDCMHEKNRLQAKSIDTAS